MSELTLLLNAAEQRVQFGLVRDDVLICGQDWAAASQGAELLAPALSDALARTALSPGDVTRIACVTGPGGFTGIRLALATASALHHALGIPLAGIEYLHLIAQSIPLLPGQQVRVLTHARRNLLHRQDFVSGVNGVVAAVGEPCVVALEQALDELDTSGPYPALLAGSGVGRYHELSAPDHSGIVSLGGRYAFPSWQAFMLLAETAPYEHADLTPLYLRASEAEDNLELLASRRGDDPSCAREALDVLLHAAPTSLV
jgi:universal bacterial protein YeaZ